MKLIVTGATGFVGMTVIRQALRHKDITRVVAIARKPVEVPDVDTSKLRTVILEDWTEEYPNSVKEEIKGADGCIWALAVTPSKSKDMDFKDVTTICYDYTINGLQNIAAVANSPFRFVYVSGVTVERDQTKALPFLGDYRLMRGRVENAILDFAKQSKCPTMEATVAKPAGIEGPDHPKTEATTALFSQFGDTPWVHVSELAAAVIDQCLHGIAKDPLWASDLKEIGSRLLQEDDQV